MFQHIQMVCSLMFSSITGSKTRTLLLLCSKLHLQTSGMLNTISKKSNSVTHFQIVHQRNNTMIQLNITYGILDDEFQQPIEGSGIWTKSEHARFLMAMKLYPQGPWKKVAAIVQTRSIRQVQAHAQKYREKIARRQRGLKTKPLVHATPLVQQQAAQHSYNPLPVGSTNPLAIDMVKTEPNVDFQNELPALPECLDFLLDLMAAVDPVKIEVL